MENNNFCLPNLEMTLLDKINGHAAVTPNQPCCHSVSFKNNQPIAESISYAHLIHQVLKVSDILKSKTKIGDRIVIAIENPIHFLITFLAVLSAKCVAVPVPPISNFKIQGVTVKRVLNIYDDCQPSLFIVENKKAWESVEILQNHLISIEDFISGYTDNFALEERLPKINLEEIAYLQYTSGSTGNPKGCMISHKNLVANIHSIGVVGDYSAQDIGVSWLPLYHDMGLLGGLLIPLYWNMKHYVLTPQQFVAKPINWLRVINQYRCTMMMGPTFGYHLVSHYVQDKYLAEIDLSRIRLAYIGAEPIPLRTVNEFIARFQDYGFKPTSFYPCYGMAECALAAALPPINRDMVIDTVDRFALINQNKAVAKDKGLNDTVSFISVGRALPSHEIIIIHPNTQKECKEREVGEIVLKGPSIFKGYFNRENIDAPLRTGDLGYIADNELYVIDRIKDLIIIAGQNYYPSDIESSLMELPLLQDTKILCFAAESDLGTESLQVLIEVKNNFATPEEQVTALVRQCIHKQFGISGIHVALVPRGSLERTSSGKLMRSIYKEKKHLIESRQQAVPETCE